LELIHSKGLIEESEEERTKHNEVIKDKESSSCNEKSFRDSQTSQGFFLA